MTAKRTGAKSAKKTAATRGAVQPEELARRRERVRLVRRLSDDEYARLSRDEREELAKKRGAKKLAELAYADFRDWLAGLSSVAGRNCALMEGARRARRAGVDCETFVAETVEAGGEPPLSAGEVRRAYERCKAEPIAPDGVAVRVPFPRPSKPKPRPPSEQEKRAQAEYAKKMELYERLTAAMEETYGERYDDFRHIHHAFMVRFGTYPEYEAGIGGAGHEAEREEWRSCHTVQLGHNWIQPDRWAKYRQDFEKRAQELLAGLSKLYAEHEGDLRAAGYLKSTGER